MKRRSLPVVLASAATLLLSLALPAAADPSAEQLGVDLSVACAGASDSSTPYCYSFAIMDADGSHVIHQPIPRWAFDFTPGLSPDGTKIAFASDRDGPLDLYLMNPDGSGVVRIVTGTASAWAPSWSPDSTRLAFNCTLQLAESPSDICAINRDGTNFTQLTSDPSRDSDPAWSPAGDTILFVSERFGLSELLLINAGDSSTPTRLMPGTLAYAPTWSGDGSRIAFHAFWQSIEDGEWQPFWYVQVANADGSAASVVAYGHTPVWRPGSAAPTERPVASFTVSCSDVTCEFDASASSDIDGTVVRYGWYFGDGTLAEGMIVGHSFAAGAVYEVRLLVMDDDAALGTASRTLDLNQAPVASFISTCSSLTCTFDASASFDPDGSVTGYSWQFGDGRTGSSPQVTHTYPADGTYEVTLRVYDLAWAYGDETGTVSVTNMPPSASFTDTCIDTTCAFDASGSSDDGPIATYAWAFGDGSSATGKTATRTYATSGSYNVTLTVTDYAGASDSVSRSVVVTQPEVHVGDLDGVSKTSGGTWTATVTVTTHDNDHRALGNATVSGSWSSGETATCTTGASGACSISLPSIPKKTASITYTVAAITSGSLVYHRILNHDPETDSNGSSVTVKKP